MRTMTHTSATGHHVLIGSVAAGLPLLPVLTGPASMPTGYRQAHVTAALIFIARWAGVKEKHAFSTLSAPSLSLLFTTASCAVASHLSATGRATPS
jgi:hypothetical protein